LPSGPHPDPGRAHGRSCAVRATQRWRLRTCTAACGSGDHRGRVDSPDRATHSRRVEVLATSAAPGSARLTLVLGGARSGKSRYAESLITALPAPWIYVATAEACDTEMTERIAAHQARRGPGWRTLETPRDVAGALAAHGTTTLLVDCLSLWILNELLEGGIVEVGIACVAVV